MNRLYLIITRDDARVVKRTPRPTPGEWVVELRVTYPPPLPVPVIPIELPAEPALEMVEAIVSEPVPEVEGEPL